MKGIVFLFILRLLLVFSRNSKSALAHPSFVDEAISELLLTYRVFGADVIPCNVYPLSVSIQSSGKKRLILDLRFINKHSWKTTVKFEDLRVVLHYLKKGSFHVFRLTLGVGIIMCLFFLLTSPSWGFPGFTRVRLHTFVSGSFRLGFPQPLTNYICIELFRPLRKNLFGSLPW